MTGRKSRVDEIVQLRSRLIHGWQHASSEANSRLYMLEHLIGHEMGPELHRHVVVSAIAALQSYQRGILVAIIESGDTYRERAASIIVEKISVKDALEWFEGKTVSFAEIVAHTASCNSVTDMLSYLDKLIGRSAKDLISIAVAPSNRKDPQAPKLIEDTDSLIRKLQRSFEWRHIFAHEAACGISISEDECRDCWFSIKNWMDAIDAILWSTIYKDVPLTQFEMNTHAYDQVDLARRALAAEMRKALIKAKQDGNASKFRRSHSLWKSSVYDWLSITYWSLDGTLWRSVAGSVMAEAFKFRAKEIKDWNESNVI